MKLPLLLWTAPVRLVSINGGEKKFVVDGAPMGPNVQTIVEHNNYPLVRGEDYEWKEGVLFLKIRLSKTDAITIMFGADP